MRPYTRFDNNSPIPEQSQLFRGKGDDEVFLEVRDNRCNADIKAECEHLWDSYKELAPQDFVEEFSNSFHARFWEMYLGVLIREFHPEVTALKDGPDFAIPHKGTTIFVEATTVSRGDGVDAVPDFSDPKCQEWLEVHDNAVPFEQSILRVTSSLQNKATANRAKEHTENGQYVIAMNLLFAEAWLGGPTPLSAMATLGVGNLFFIMGDNDGRDSRFTNHISSVPKKSGNEVATTAFECPDYDHVSALLVASINRFSTSYDEPSMELLHNPRATNPLPREWLPVGTEYWFEENSLRNSDHGSPTEAIAM